jgi:hypothetical protein
MPFASHDNRFPDNGSSLRSVLPAISKFYRGSLRLAPDQILATKSVPVARILPDFLKPWSGPDRLQSEACRPTTITPGCAVDRLHGLLRAADLLRMLKQLLAWKRHPQLIRHCTRNTQVRKINILWNERGRLPILWVNQCYKIIQSTQF